MIDLKFMGISFIAAMLSVSAVAETSLTVELPIVAVAGEFGTKVSPNDYVSLSLYVGVSNLYGGSVSWVHSASNSDSHWFGGGVGNMTDDGDNSIISFDIGTYVSLDYKYFKNGLSSRGFYFNTSLRAQSDGAFPWFGFGYNW